MRKLVHYRNIFRAIYFPNLSFPPPFRGGIFFPKSKRAIEVFPKPIFFPQAHFFPQGIFSEQIFPQTKFFPQPLLPPFFFPLLCSLFPSIPPFSSFFFSFFLLFSSFSSSFFFFSPFFPSLFLFFPLPLFFSLIFHHFFSLAHFPPRGAG